MHQQIPHTSGLMPGYLRMCSPSLPGHATSGFADDAEFLQNRASDQIVFDKAL